ncbi:hypothetical protein LVJ94_33745 [Pendulispora rubella]|uniref:Cytochrome c domain-containing protein n=1 Tax=Pendulispora rubella TaxID=2741070 RepID=A0ABZ2KT81_9BACT
MANPSRLFALLVVAVAVPAFIACGSDSHDDGDGHTHPGDGQIGPPSGATCPSRSTLTYENFGRTFMESYCTRCHSSTLSGSARNGAPAFHDFDSLTGILDVGNHVDQFAAFGPSSKNETMPPSGPRPSADERTKLGEWLACELARTGGSSH